MHNQIALTSKREFLTAKNNPLPNGPLIQDFLAAALLTLELQTLIVTPTKDLTHEINVTDVSFLEIMGLIG